MEKLKWEIDKLKSIIGKCEIALCALRQIKMDIDNLELTTLEGLDDDGYIEGCIGACAEFQKDIEGLVEDKESCLP